MRTNPVCDPRAAFFDSVADKWDSRRDLPDLALNLDACLAQFGVTGAEIVLDVGCGTGNLTMALLRRLGRSGRIVAIDISQRMLEQARKKAGDTRVTWHCAPAGKIPVDEQTIDRILCFSAWPHFEDPDTVAAEFYRVLRPGGFLHIWHLVSRAKVNRIHQEADPSIRHDRLDPVGETAALLKKNRFSVISAADDKTRYCITARKEELRA